MICDWRYEDQTDLSDNDLSAEISLADNGNDSGEFSELTRRRKSWAYSSIASEDGLIRIVMRFIQEQRRQLFFETIHSETDKPKTTPISEAQILAAVASQREKKEKRYSKYSQKQWR